jgi:hypothetical protein
LSTKTHDELIRESIRWAESLGYKVIEHHLGTETGADAIFQNHAGEKAVLEMVTGSSFTNLFGKERIKNALKNDYILGLIVVGDRINNLKDHGIKAGLSSELFESGHKEQKVFGVLVRDFNAIIPVLLVSILGTKGSPNHVRIH